MTVGKEWLIDASGCRADLLRDRAGAHALDQLIADLDLHVVGEGQWHQFPDPGGWTILLLLTESHLACHTYPESGSVTFNLYCCREREPWNWEEGLREFLGAKHVQVRTITRGSSGETL